MADNTTQPVLRLDQGLDGPDFVVRFKTETKDFFFFTESKMTLGLAKLPIQWIKSKAIPTTGLGGL
jgi:hypothetical protein